MTCSKKEGKNMGCADIHILSGKYFLNSKTMEVFDENENLIGEASSILVNGNTVGYEIKTPNHEKDT